MFVHTGGGGKGIRPNQHNQQQQQQQQAQQQQQLHHHQSQFQSQQQQQQQQHLQQQQQQLQVAGSVVHHNNQNSSQSSANSHSHPHQQQQQQPVHQHQQQFQHHQVPLTFFSYPLSQIQQHQHPGQTSGNNVGSTQMAPSPPSHTGGNGSQGGGGGGINNSNGGGGNNTNATNNMGGNRQANNSNSMPHFATGSALMQATLPPPNNNPFMTPTYMQLQQQNTAVMVAAQYNSVAAAAAAAAGQHGNPVGGQTGHTLYQNPQQTQPPQTHQQATVIHGGQTTLHYFPNAALNAAHAPTPIHQHPQQHHQIRNMLAAATHPRPQYLMSPGNYFTLSHATLPPPARASLLTNAHQQSATAGAGVGTAVHVATQLQNTAGRGAATGPTTYVPPPYCTPPLQMGAGAALTPQPTSMLAAASALGPPSLQPTYGHLTGVPTTSTSSTSINIPTAVGGLLGGGLITPTTTGTEIKGTKPRKHAIPIINPITLEKVTFEPQRKSTAVEVKPPPPPLPVAPSTPNAVEDEISQSKSISMATISTKTESESISMEMENDKSITVSVASAPLMPPPASITPPALEIAAALITSPNNTKIDQQMQTDAIKDKNKLETSAVAAAAAPLSDMQLSLPTGESSLQTCVEDPDDTDADTNEHELNNEDDIEDISLEQQQLKAAHIDSELTTNLNTNQQKVITNDNEFQTVESDTDHTTETEVKSTSQIEDDAKNEVLQTESSTAKQETKHVIENTNLKQTSLEKICQNIKVKDFLPTKKVYTNTDEIIPKDNNNKMTLLNKETPTDETITSLSATVTINEQKNITTTASANPITTKNKDQNKFTKTLNTTNMNPSNNSGNSKNSKQNSFSNSQKQIITNTDTTSKTNTPPHLTVSSNVATTSGNTNAGSKNHNNTNNNNNNNNNNMNNNNFITVGNRKKGKTGKRAKENQKKLQQQQQQQQQQKLQETPTSSSTTTTCNQRSNSTISSTNINSNNNNKTSNNNNTNLSLSSTNAATNILLTDIHNANSISISSSSISGNLREHNKHQQANAQQHQQSTSKSNNNKNTGNQSKGTDAKIETESNQRKSIKTQEIVERYLQPTTLEEESSTLTVDEQQMQFLNSSSSTCDDEEEKLQLLRQNQQMQSQDLEDLNLQFGDIKEYEKIIDTKVTTKVSTQNKPKSTPLDTVDCSSNLATHTRGGVATITPHSKANKGHHSHHQHHSHSNTSGAVQKHKGKHLPPIRYSLELLKSLAESPESCKTPIVPCQKGDCISQLFVSRQQHHQYHLPHQGSGGGTGGASTNLHLQQQYQHMNFNESMEFVTGKRHGGGQPRKHHDHRNANAGNVTASNVNAAGGTAPGSSVSTSGTAGGQFPRKMEVIRIHLSLNEEIKLSKCENAWQPEPLRSKSNNTSPTAGPNDDIDVVLKKVRGILNKLTPDNFDILLKTMTSVSMNTQEKMQQVMLLIFEKTISEPNFAPTYAKFCKVLSQEIKQESKKMFNDSLIKRIQTEFEVNVNDADAKKLKLQPLVDKMEASTDAKERNELQAEIEDQEYQFRRRAWGTVRFIGEMFKLQSLTGDRVLLCIESLLEHGSEEKLEYMCKLLTTVGHLLEGYAGENIRMDKIFRKIQEIVNGAKNKGKSSSNSNATQTKISSRVRFMMQDVMDLRGRNWDQATVIKPATQNTNATATSSQQQQQHHQQQPQHHQQHRRQRQQDDKNNQSGSDRGFQRMGSYGSNNQSNRQTRTTMPDIRESGGVTTTTTSSSGNYFMQKQQKSQQYTNQQEQQQSIDLKKLNFSRGDDSTKLGNKSTYMWRTPGRLLSQNSSTTTNTPTLGGGITSSQQYLSGKTLQQQQQIANSMNTRNTFNKRQTTNQFQVLSPTPDTASQINTERENLMVSSGTSVSSGSSVNDNASSEDQDKTFLSSYLPKEHQKRLNHFMEEFLDCLPSHSTAWQAEVLTSFRSISQKQQSCLIYYLLMDYLHLANVKKLQRNACANIFSYLLRNEAFDMKIFARAYEQFSEDFPDLLVDVPNGWAYVFEFLGPLLHERLLNFTDIWQSQWQDDRQFTERFVNAFIVYFTKEFGANYIRDLWHKEYKLDRGQLFIADNQQWREFINTHNLQYIYDRNTKPQNVSINSTTSSSSTSFTSTNSTVEQQVKRLEMLLKQANDCDLAIDYINTNVNINNNFLRNLTQFLCCDYATVVITTSSASTATTTTISSSSNSSTSNTSSKCTNSKKSSSSSSDLPINSSSTTLATGKRRPHLNVDLFRKNCLPLLRLCLDAQEDYEVTCLDAVVDSIQQYYDLHTANELICSIFDILYDCEVIAKESFEKWYRQRQHQDERVAAAASTAAATYKKTLSAHLQAYMQKLL